MLSAHISRRKFDALGYFILSNILFSFIVTIPIILINHETKYGDFTGIQFFSSYFGISTGIFIILAILDGILSICIWFGIHGQSPDETALSEKHWFFRIKNLTSNFIVLVLATLMIYADYQILKMVNELNLTEHEINSSELNVECLQCGDEPCANEHSAELCFTKPVYESIVFYQRIMKVLAFFTTLFWPVYQLMRYRIMVRPVKGLKDPYYGKNTKIMIS